MRTEYIYSKLFTHFSMPYAYFMILSTTLIFSSNLQAHVHHQHNIKPIHILNASINPTVAGMKVTGAYLTLHNLTQEDITLLNASSTLSNRVELHQHTMKDGLMRMQKLQQGITIPTNNKTTLEPGGYHIMIMNLTQAVKEGKRYDLTLKFSTQHH